MACERYLNSIHESIDGTIGSIRRAELEMHLDQCEDCRALYDDLKRIHDAAAALPPLDAPDRAWLQIAGRLRQEGRIYEEATAPASGRRHYVGWLAAAAAVILAVAAAVMFLRPPSAPAPQTARQSAPPATAPAVAATDPKALESATSAVEAAQGQFEKAIADLEKVAKANQQVLDPSTATTIDKNLGILDQAIAENRAAVKTDPTSAAARETLFETLRQKVTLLQDTISLINEMRKGNNAAAAQLMNKS
jgi:tetratricopeptide (TPR) repeat protein